VRSGSTERSASPPECPLADGPSQVHFLGLQFAPGGPRVFETKPNEDIYMLDPTQTVPRASRETFRLGVIDFRILAASDETDGAFALGEFSGGEGAWTLPHVHATSLEAFYVLDGRFTFTLGEEDFEAVPGSFVLIPRNTRHLMRAEAGGGRFLTLWTPGGLEQMFAELSQLSPDALRDPSVRKAISGRFDSIPV
jgi:quercetin dioxygenase-like cupin family protein